MADKKGEGADEKPPERSIFDSLSQFPEESIDLERPLPENASIDEIAYHRARMAAAEDAKNRNESSEPGGFPLTGWVIIGLFFIVVNMLLFLTTGTCIIPVPR